MRSYVLGIVVLAATAACGGNAANAVTPRPEDPVAWGGQLYGAKCARCHGDHGEGHGDAPAVVGEGALPLDPPAKAKFRKGKFETAKDVHDFVRAAMPPGHGGSLTDDEYWALIAFDLDANKVKVTGKLDDVAAAQIKLH